MSDEPFTEKEEEEYSAMQMSEDDLNLSTLFHFDGCTCPLCKEWNRRHPNPAIPFLEQITPKRKEVSIPIPFEFFKKRTLAELLEIRDDFIVENRTSTCTCDTCCISLMCALAYDYYNTDGDCLLEK